MLTRYSRISFIATCAWLAGCASLGPKFSAPANVVEANAQYRHGGTSTSTNASLPKNWWEIFGDAQLNQLEQRALQAHPTIKIAAERLLQAKAQLGISDAAQQPYVSVGAGISNGHTSQNTAQGQLFGGRTVSGNNFSVGGALSYEVELWGKMQHIHEAAQAQVQAAEYDKDGVLLLLSSQIANTYWQLRGIQAELSILNETLANRKEAQQLIERRFGGGLSNELDVSRARLETANATADMAEVERQRNLLQHALAVLVAAPPATLLPVAAGPLSEPPAIPVGLPATLLAQRPDLAQSVALIRAANAQQGVAESAFYPSLQLTGNFGLASESLRDLAQGGSRQFSIGPLALSLPIFDGGRNKANLALTQARYQEALAQHQVKLLNALREVEDALSDGEQRKKQEGAQALAQQAANRAQAVAQQRFVKGLSNYLDVTDTQRSALAANRAANQIRTQRWLAATALARALGGGWTAGTVQ